MGKEKYKEKTLVKDKTTTIKSIVVYNDDVNTFDHVIDCFIKILELDLNEAIAHTMAVHYNGKSAVKSGSYKELEPYALSLLNEKLSCKIE